jgi:hypothetical protein
MYRRDDFYESEEGYLVFKGNSWGMPTSDQVYANRQLLFEAQELSVDITLKSVQPWWMDEDQRLSNRGKLHQLVWENADYVRMIVRNEQGELEPLLPIDPGSSAALIRVMVLPSWKQLGCSVCSLPSQHHCEGCGERYCSTACQIKDWSSGHRYVCGEFPEPV